MCVASHRSTLAPGIGVLDGCVNARLGMGVELTLKRR